MADGYTDKPTAPRKGRKTKTSRDPFEVKLSEDRETDLAAFLCRELDYAEQARDVIVGDDGLIDQAHEMYEGGNASLTKNTPWVGASNLGSFIVTEKVDSMRARIAATIFADPVWIVEGFGDAAQRAPFVESYMQWKAEQSKLQGFLTRSVHNSLIEGTGVLEVSDRVVMRRGLRKIKALLQRDHMTGATMLDESGNEIPVRYEDGRYVEAGADEPHLEMVVNDLVRATAGASFRVLTLKNFFILPGHAAEREDIWGYAKKLYRRLPELQCRERDGYYRNVDKIGLAGDREESGGASSETPADIRAGYTPPPQREVTADKEIWEITLLADLDGDDYEEWYVITLSRIHRTILRVQYQDYGTPHYILFTPFPRPNSVYGYSYAMDKLGSLYDEHSALRNQFADRSTLAVSAPFLQIEGSPWNPALKPFGPRQVINVRDLNELKQLEVRDVPQSVMAALQMVLSAAERLSGQNDTTTGHMAQQDRTLGEVKIVTEQSFVRIDEVVKNFQEGMEDLFNLLLIILKNKLQGEPEQLPGDILLTMQERGMPIQSATVTVAMLDGVFRGKPHGSVEGADFSKMRTDFAGMMTSLTQLAQAVPAVQMHLNNPQVVRSIVSQLARIYRWPDRMNMVGMFSGEGMPPMMPGAPGQPGMPQQPGQQPPATSPMSGAPPNASPPRQQ